MLAIVVACFLIVLSVVWAPLCWLGFHRFVYSVGFFFHGFVYGVGLLFFLMSMIVWPTGCLESAGVMKRNGMI